MRLAPGIALALGLAPGAARAHAFDLSSSGYANFLDGAGVVLGSPGLLLPLLALAVALGLWRSEGLLTAWPWVLGATLSAQPLALLAGPWAALVPLALGLVNAALAALVPLGRIAPALVPLSVLTALAAMVSALEGHGWAEVPWSTRAGLLFGLHFALAATAGLVRLARDHIRHRATDIAWRVAASWLAAILVLYLAFLLRG